MSPTNALFLDGDHVTRMRSILKGMLQALDLRCVLLIHRDGTILSMDGDLSGFNVTNLAALIAGSFATAREVARLLGEPEFTVLFNQGVDRHIHNSLVDNDTILTVIFSDIGIIEDLRQSCLEGGASIATILAAARETSRAQEDSGAAAGQQGESFDDMDEPTQKRLDKVFGKTRIDQPKE